MKLHRLKIKNIASLENAEIDFDADPIAGADVFLISGPTGAGKSTILDAVAIALYGRIPRFGNTSRGADEYDNVSYNDVRQILRQGTGKGDIILSFDGNDGCSYESHWTVRRAYDRPDRNFQSVEWTLVCNGDMASALTKGADIRPAIVKALGIDYEQFVRTSMLAQGEFTRFLKAGDSEKSAILTKLTRTEIYSQIGRRIFEKTKSKKEDYELQHALIANEHLLTEEEITALNVEKEKAVTEAESIRQTIEALTRRRQWLEQRNAVASQTEASAKTLAMARGAADSEEAAVLRKTVADWRVATPAREALRNMSVCNAEIADANAALDALRNEYSRVAGAFDLLRSDMRMKAEEATVAGENCAAMSWQAPAFEKYERIISRLDAITDNRKRAEAELGRIAGLEKELADDAKVVEERKTLLAKAEERLESARSVLVAAEKEALRYDMEALSVAQKRWQSRINTCDNIKSAVEQLNADTRTLRERQEALDREQKAVAHREAEMPALQTACDEAEKNRKNSDDLYKVLDFSHQNWASAARATLTPGCTCPVCRQTVGQLPPMEAVLTEQWMQARRKAENDRLAAEEATKKLSAAQADIAARKKSCHAEQKRIDEQTELLKASEKKILEQAATIAVPVVEPDAVDAARREAEQNLVSVTADISRSVQAAVAVKKANAQVSAATDECNKARAALHQADTALNVVRERLENCRKNVDEARRKADTDIEALRADESLAVWKTKASRMFFNAEEFKNYFMAARHESDAATQRLEALRNESARLSEAVVSFETILDSILHQRPEWAVVEHIPARIAQIDVALSRLSTKVAAENAALVTAQAKKTRFSVEYERFRHEYPQYSDEDIRRLSLLSDETVSASEKRLRDIDDTLLRAKTAYGEIKARLEALEQNRPELGEGDTAESLRIQAEGLTRKQAELHSQSGAVAARLEQNAKTLERVAALKLKSDKAYAEWQKWALLNEQFGSADGAKFNRIAQSFVLRSLLERANVHLRRLSGRYQLRGVDGQYIILLEDAENNYRCRPVVTGSGGESFLVSLALALALAEGGNNVSADILFIDEGFGTLSGEPLQRAVNLLRSLHSASGKQVGIISHVEELKSEIPVQIRVRPAPSGGASTLEVIRLME